MKPIIHKKSKIGKNKFEKILTSIPDIRKKEIQLLSIPGKEIHDVSINRRKNNVGKDVTKIEKLLNEKVKENFKKKINNFENRSQLLHTHIIEKSNKTMYGTALPSFSDIISFIKDRKRTIKYQIISVINPKNGLPIGYTTIKIEKNMITPEKFVEKMKPYLTTSNKKTGEYKKYLLKEISALGIKIVFTPETNYKLDKNFNFVPKVNTI